jgi:hypothetical protein
MASILDLPPELILLIMLYLKCPTTSSHWTRTRPVPAIDEGYLCPCSEEGYRSVGELLIYGWQEDSRNVVRFGTSHPYIMDCIDQSRYCEIVDACVTDRGVLPSLTTTIPSAVR